MAQTTNCMRKCKKVGEIMPTEVGPCAVLAKRAMGFDSSSDSFKRRKLEPNADSNRLIISHCNETKSPEDSASPATSEASNCVLVSRCSSGDSSELSEHESQSLDLKVELHPGALESEISMAVDCRFSRETIPSSEFCADTDYLEFSASTKPLEVSLGRNPPAANMSSPAEIEEFLSAVEKREQKRFADKYNYDIVKDVPLEGRYEWVRLKP